MLFPRPAEVGQPRHSFIAPNLAVELNNANRLTFPITDYCPASCSVHQVTGAGLKLPIPIRLNRVQITPPYGSQSGLCRVSCSASILPLE
jgi:hypothetical protein